jgi:hypothetical protein
MIGETVGVVLYPADHRADEVDPADPGRSAGVTPGVVQSTGGGLLVSVGLLGGVSGPAATRQSGLSRDSRG